MSFYFSPSDLPRDEKLLLLPDRIDTNVFPFPSIHTPGVPFPSIYTPGSSVPVNPTITVTRAPSPLSYHNSPTSPLLPRPVTDRTTPTSHWRQSLAWGFLQYLTSASAAFVGWDMVSGCVLYDPNPIYGIERICAQSNFNGAILSISLALLSSAMLLHVRLRPRDTHIHPQRVSTTLLFLGPVTSFLLGALCAFVVLGNLGPQGIAILHILSALCACFSVFTAVLSNSV